MNPLTCVDEIIQEMVWETKVPLKIEMALKDLISSSAPLTLYFILPRIGYLTSIFESILKSFENCITANLSDIWLEYNGIPIKWQYPLGVIVDSLNIDISKGPIPIFVHVRNMPTDEVLKYENLDSLRFYYINSLKEANAIKFPTVNKILNLNPNDTAELRKVVYSKDAKMIKEYRMVMNNVNGNGFEKIVRYPVKLVFCKGKVCVNKPIKIDESGNENEYLLKDYFDSVLGKEKYAQFKEKYKIVIHGIEVEEEMPFLFYYWNFSYLDNYLYITFIDNKGDIK